MCFSRIRTYTYRYAYVRMYSTSQIYTYCAKYSTWAYASIQKILVWWYASTNGVGPWKKRRLKTIAKTHWDGETVLNFTLAFVRYAPYRTHFRTRNAADGCCTVVCCFSFSYPFWLMQKIFSSVDTWSLSIGTFVRSFVRSFLCISLAIQVNVAPKQINA